MDRKEYMKQWREKNKEKIREYSKQYFQENKDDIYTTRNKYYQENKTDILAKRHEKEKETGYHHKYLNTYKECVCGKLLKTSSFYQHRKICSTYNSTLENKMN